MYRLIISFLILQVVAGHRNWCERHPNICTHRHYDYHRGSHDNDRQFRETSWQVVRLDRKLQGLCESGTNYTTESYHAKSYKLSVTLDGFDADDIAVKLKHRVLFIQASKKGDVKVFSELKVLPDFVNGKEAVWSFYDNVLEINMPLLITPGTVVTKSCVADIDESVKTIPKLDIISVRFGDTETTAVPISENVV